MTDDNTVIPFVLASRWIFTVERERVFVNVRHRTRWYAVARRKGHEDRRHRCASRNDALWTVKQMRKAFEDWEFAQQAQAMLDRMPPIQRARAIEELRALANRAPTGD